MLPSQRAGPMLGQRRGPARAVLGTTGAVPGGRVRRAALQLDVGQSSTGSGGAQGNPLLAMYRKWTLQYKKDAEEAYAAANDYAEKTKMVADGVNAKDVSVQVKKKLKSPNSI